MCHLPTGKPFASLVLQAAYEATMWAAVLNAQRGASNVVLLTQLGGGAFGNQDDWINTAMRRSLELMLEFDLDVRLVSYGTPSRAICILQSILAGATRPFPEKCLRLHANHLPGRSELRFCCSAEQDIQYWLKTGLH